jgi:hypothetical protein
MAVKLTHADGNGNTGINVQATIRNCTAVPEPFRLDVAVPIQRRYRSSSRRAAEHFSRGVR